MKKIIYLYVIFGLISTFCASICFASENEELEIVDSGIANAAGFTRPSGAAELFAGKMGDPYFIKNNFIYFTPDEDYMYYWCKFNKPKYTPKSLRVNVILADGSYMYQKHSLSWHTEALDDSIRVYTMFIDGWLEKIKAKPSQYGKCTLEVYRGKRLLDKKTFYIDIHDKLVEFAKSNNEDPRVIQHLNDRSEFKNKNYVVLDKDGRVKFIFEGFSLDRLEAELGEPWKKEETAEKGKEKWTYLTRYHLMVKAGWAGVLPLTDEYLGKIVRDKSESGYFGYVIFIIKDGKIVKIRGE